MCCKDVNGDSIRDWNRIHDDEPAKSYLCKVFFNNVIFLQHFYCCFRSSLSKTTRAGFIKHAKSNYHIQKADGRKKHLPGQQIFSVANIENNGPCLTDTDDDGGGEGHVRGGREGGTASQNI